MNNFIIILQLVHSMQASMVIYLKDQLTGTHYPLDIRADATINDIVRSPVINQFDASSIELLFDGQNLLRDDIDVFQPLSDIGIGAESQLIIGRKKQEMVELNAIIHTKDTNEKRISWNCTIRRSMTFDDIKYQFEKECGYNVRALLISRDSRPTDAVEPWFTYSLSLKNLSVSISKSRISDAVPPPDSFMNDLFGFYSDDYYYAVTGFDEDYSADWDAMSEECKWWNHEMYERWPRHPNSSLLEIRDIRSVPPMSDWESYFSKIIQMSPKIIQNEVIPVHKPFSFDDVYFDVYAALNGRRQRICLCDEFMKLPDDAFIYSGFPSSWDGNSSAVAMVLLPWHYTLNVV